MELVASDSSRPAQILDVSSTEITEGIAINIRSVWIQECNLIAPQSSLWYSVFSVLLTVEYLFSRGDFQGSHCRSQLWCGRDIYCRKIQNKCWRLLCHSFPCKEVKMQTADIFLLSIFLLFIFPSQIFLSFVFKHGFRAKPALGLIRVHSWFKQSAHRIQ